MASACWTIACSSSLNIWIRSACWASAFSLPGDGVAVYRQQIADCLGDRVRFAAAPCAYLRPAARGCLAARDADKAVDYLTLQPLYLRAPQAERERAAREAKQHG